MERELDMMPPPNIAARRARLARLILALFLILAPLLVGCGGADHSDFYRDWCGSMLGAARTSTDTVIVYSQHHQCATLVRDGSLRPTRAHP